MTAPTKALRLMIYDKTCRGSDRRLPLSAAWWGGGHLYRTLGRFDYWQGVESWESALQWLATVAPDRPIAEIQFWGHGRWGQVLIQKQVLTTHVLDPNHTLHPHLTRIRNRLDSTTALWWFRTCETFGSDLGQDFARRWTDFFDCHAAGHTHIIGFWQSGLHRIAPGESPSWSPSEGLLEGSAARPVRARNSSPRRPHTITCLQGSIPDRF